MNNDIGEMMSGIHDKYDPSCTGVSGLMHRTCSRQAAYPEISPGECYSFGKVQLCVCNTPLCNA